MTAVLAESGPPLPASPFAPAPMRPRVWTVFAALLVVVVAIFTLQLLAVLPLVIWHLQRGVKPDQLQAALVASLSHPAAFIGLAALSQLAIAVTTLLCAWLSPVPFAERLGFVRSAWSGREVAIVLLGAIVPLAIGVAAAYALAEVITPDPSVKNLFANMTLGWSVPFVLFIALAPAFAEEMFFRGYMQRRLMARLGPLAALSITAVIFGLFHVTPHGVAAAFPLGVWLGLMAWKSGSIWPGILCHALVNGLWNIRSLVVRFEVIPELPPIWAFIALLAPGLLAFAWSLRILFAPPKANLASVPPIGTLASREPQAP